MTDKDLEQELMKNIVKEVLMGLTIGTLLSMKEKILSGNEEDAKNLRDGLIMELLATVSLVYTRMELREGRAFDLSHTEHEIRDMVVDRVFSAIKAADFQEEFLKFL